MFYLINKEKGISSFKAIRKFAKENGIKKIGHTGTLDPLATGLLLVATEDDTKLIDYIDKGVKSYIATMQLGYESDTLDIEGEVNPTGNEFKEEDVEKTIMSYIKTYDQMPPDFSAKKINGKRAYELAREGKEVILKTSKITITNISNIKRVNEDTYQFEVEVSRGTYIRSLIRDIGNDLGCGAIMTDLVRNKLAGFDLSDSNSEVKANQLIKLDTVEVKELKRLFDGKNVEVNVQDGKFAATFNDEIIGIIDVINKRIVNRKLFGIRYERIKNESNKIS